MLRALCFLNLDFDLETRGVMVRRKRRPPPGQGGGKSRFPLPKGVDLVLFISIGLERPVTVNDFNVCSVSFSLDEFDEFESSFASSLGEAPRGVAKLRCGEPAPR